MGRIKKSRRGGEEVPLQLPHERTKKKKDQKKTVVNLLPCRGGERKEKTIESSSLETTLSRGTDLK